MYIVSGVRLVCDDGSYVGTLGYEIRLEHKGTSSMSVGCVVRVVGVVGVVGVESDWIVINDVVVVVDVDDVGDVVDDLVVDVDDLVLVVGDVGDDVGNLVLVVINDSFVL